VRISPTVLALDNANLWPSDMLECGIPGMGLPF
jgi:hypothetical protein